MDKLDSPITTIPGLGFRMAAMILAEVGDFTRLIPRTNYWPMPGCLPLLTSLGSLRIATRT